MIFHVISSPKPSVMPGHARSRAQGGMAEDFCWSGRSILIHPSDCFLSQISPNLSLILAFDAYSVMQIQEHQRYNFRNMTYHCQCQHDRFCWSWCKGLKFPPLQEQSLVSTMQVSVGLEDRVKNLESMATRVMGKCMYIYLYPHIFKRRPHLENQNTFLYPIFSCHTFVHHIIYINIMYMYHHM